MLQLHHKSPTTTTNISSQPLQEKCGILADEEIYKYRYNYVLTHGP